MRFIVFSCLSPLLGALALLLFVGFRYGKPTWLLDQGNILVGLLLGVAFISGRLWLTSERVHTQRPFWMMIRIGVVGAMLSLPLILMLLLTDLRISRLMVIYEIALLYLLLSINALPLPRTAKLLVNLSLFAVASLPSFSQSSRRELMGMISGQEIALNSSVDYVFSSLHDVKTTNYVIFEEKGEPNGGGLDLVDENRLLLITGDGRSFLVSLGVEDVKLRATNIHAPINLGAYLGQAASPSQYFRVTDILLEPAATEERSLYVTHHYWDSKNRCLTLRMSEARVEPGLTNIDNPEWTTRYESTPCLSKDKVPNTTGGRLAFLDGSSILMTVGDHGDQKLVPRDDSSYGKIVEIDRRDWTARVFTRGHRNPQGLSVSDGQIWETEHGPRGGDELNLLVFGEDYGWPHETYGTDYRNRKWRFEKPGDHSTKRRPIYAWVPSIGVSNLIRISGAAFQGWKGDLVVSSLYGKGNGYSLFRVKTREGRAVLVERIQTGLPVRDLLEMPDGRIVLWDGDDTIQVVEPASHVFSQCSGCHALRGTQHGIGPDLWGVVGRRVAEHEDYRYSRALTDFGGEWSTARLDAFLANPGRAVPGTTMEFAGIEDPEDRRAIIEYLQKLADH